MLYISLFSTVGLPIWNGRDINLFAFDLIDINQIHYV